MNPSEPTRSPTSLEGRRILVTGGAQGLGEAISARIVDLGGQVLIADVLVDSDPATTEAIRLLSMLDLVVPLFADDVPATSILREFIGGSAFDY